MISGSGRGQRRRTSHPQRRPPPAGASPESGGRLGRVQEDEGAFGRYGAVKAVGSTRRRGLEDEDDPSRRGRVASPEKRAPVAGRTLGLARRDPSVLPAAERVLPRGGSRRHETIKMTQTSPPEAGLLMRQSTFRNKTRYNF